MFDKEPGTMHTLSHGPLDIRHGQLHAIDEEVERCINKNNTGENALSHPGLSDEIKLSSPMSLCFLERKLEVKVVK